MATKVLRLLSIGIASIIAIVIFTLLSCDKRHAIGSIEDNTALNVRSVRVILSPRQIRLLSQEAIDSVQIRIAVLDSEGVGIPNIKVKVTRTPSIGFVTQPDSTDSQGQTNALFIADPGVYDSTRITVSAGDISSSAMLFISGPTRYTLNINYSPPVPKLIDHEALPYQVIASLVDTTQRGVSGQPVTFSSVNQVGRIGFSDPNVTIPHTNSQGQAEALFYNTQIDEISEPDHAEIQAVTPSPDGMGIIANSVVIPMRAVLNTLTLVAVPMDVIGNGADSVTIRAFLHDTDGHGIVGDTIRFRCLSFSGVVPAMRITDENGIATATFTPFGGVAAPETTQILAEYRAGSIHQAAAQIAIRILPITSIGTITVTPQVGYVVANGSDSLSLFITVQDSSGRLIGDGTAIYINNNGLGTLSATQLVTVNGQARATLRSPLRFFNTHRVDSIFVKSSFSDSNLVADTAIINYVAGPIGNISFTYPESSMTLVAGSGDTCSVIAYATDINDNPVADGTQILFRNGAVTTSSLVPQIAGTHNGFVRSIYLVGTGTGDDNVIAFTPDPVDPYDTIRTLHPVVFRCISSNATTLELSAAQSSIQVGGASTQIIATLQDAFGNSLSEGYVVAFHITVGPGDTPERRPSFDTSPGVYYDTAETNINGQAIVQLYSGLKAGAVSIKACTIPLPPESLYVCDEKSLVTISSGPPYQIQISPAITGEGSQNHPERTCLVAALVWDRYTNPVEHGTAVYFSLIPDDLGEIDGNSYTGGGQPYMQDSTEGVAYSRIIYPCISTFEHLQVVSSSAGDLAEVADTSEVISFPIYGGQIELMAVPGNLRTTSGLMSSTDTSFITATLTDDGGCPIKGGIINFTALVVGNIIGSGVDTTDNNGHAYTSFMIHGSEIPCQVNECTIDATVKATLVQRPSVFSVINISCSRPLD